MGAVNIFCAARAHNSIMVDGVNGWGNGWKLVGSVLTHCWQCTALERIPGKRLESLELEKTAENREKTTFKPTNLNLILIYINREFPTYNFDLLYHFPNHNSSGTPL